MKYKLHRLVLTLAAAVPVMVVLILSAPAAPAALAFPRAATDSESSVTVIVLDMSGSMGTNDPQGIRCSAADAYIRLSGPGDFIGVVGLENTNGVTGGSHNFQVAQKWSDPKEMATQSARNSLISAIAKRSSNDCHPNGNTPTYDALSQAESMLEGSAKQGITKGQIILLTDGTPAPDPERQVNAITTDIVPVMQQHGWSINTVALGPNAKDQGIDYHGFLAGLSRATSGGSYDDSKGPISGVSPLNVTPFFLDIFQRFHTSVLNLDIPYTTLQRPTFARNFPVVAYAEHLDVLVAKDDRFMTGVLRDATGRVVNSSTAGVTLVNESYFLLFSVDSPGSGLWELDLKGSPGSHLMVYDFTASSLGVQIGSVSTSGAGQNLLGGTNALPLGSVLTVTAHLTSAGQIVSNPDFALAGNVEYKGKDGSFQQSFSLQPTPGGAYQGTVTIPTSAPVGSYGVTVAVKGTSGPRSLAQSQEVAFRVALFPTALFIQCATLSGVKTCEATPDTVNSTAPEWDPVLQHVYALPGVSWLGRWALNSPTSQPTANVSGRVLVGEQSYAGATVFGSAQKVGSHSTIPVTIDQHGDGNFTASFVPPSVGTYVVTLNIRGSLLNTTGDLAVVKRNVTVAFAAASTSDDLVAWLKTATCLLILATIAAIANYVARPKPYVIVTVGSRTGPQKPEPKRVQVHNPGDLLRRVFQRNTVDSSQLGLGPGMRIQFSRDDWRGRRQNMWVRETQKYSEWKDADGQLFRVRKSNDANWFERLLKGQPDARRWRRLGAEHEIRRGQLRFKLTTRKPRGRRTGGPKKK
jgi:hypothetical protein